jgi:hypothetical protein
MQIKRWQRLGLLASVIWVIVGGLLASWNETWIAAGGFIALSRLTPHVQALLSSSWCIGKRSRAL